MLLDADETLLHQVPLTMAQCGSTDHRFYDRYVFGGWDDVGGCGVLVGVGFYKNMNVADGFLVVQRDRRQHNLRLSRSLGADRSVARVGPLQVRIDEPFRRIRLDVAPNASRLACALEWTSDQAVHYEPPHRMALGEALVSDYTRYNQSGLIRGHLELEGRRIDVDRWWSMRDHSWGVRPGVGGFEPVRPGAGEASETRALLLSLFFNTDAYSCHMIRTENRAGEVLYQRGTRIARGLAEAAPVELVDWKHEIDFVPGSHAVQALRYRTTWSDGSELAILGEPLHAAWAFRGAGYDGGFQDGRGLGAQRGDCLEHDVYDLAHPEIVLDPNGNPLRAAHREQPARLIVNGQATTGYAPVLVYS